MAGSDRTRSGETVSCTNRQCGARAEAFRTWLMTTYGEQHLASGVLDVAAGAGELSFLLLNLHGIDCVALDPRPLAVSSADRGCRSTLTAPAA